jgi:hypothetical protein
VRAKLTFLTAQALGALCAFLATHGLRTLMATHGFRI